MMSRKSVPNYSTQLRQYAAQVRNNGFILNVYSMAI